MTTSDGTDGTDGFEGRLFSGVSFRGARFWRSNLDGVRMRAVSVDGLDIDSHDLALGALLVNGVDVVPLVEAALDEQFPGRALKRSEDLDGLRKGYEAVAAAWAETVASTPLDLVDAQVDGEWSLAQTQRHLVLATDAWLRGAILGVDQPFHEIGQIFTGAAEWGFDMSVFRAEPPSYDEVLAVRAERQDLVRHFLADASEEALAEVRDDPWGGDWTPTVADCIRVILDEEWAHLRYARRDLATLTG